jgi:predicted PurR-regulated permease PerM/CheY-like chemotaxis protein
VLLVVGALHVAQPILVPMALAILLVFVLGPVVGPLERRLGRVAAVALVIACLWAIAGGLAWTVTRQITSFAQELPQYRSRLRQRVAELRRATSSPDVGQLQTTVDELLAEFRPGAEAPPALVVQPPPASLVPLSTLFKALGMAGLTTLLLVFMLIERQELRNRLIRLAGHGRLAMTTKAMDEASRRISRYLLSQAALNAGFGVCAGLGLFALGVPYALAWGVLAALLRFIPFVGFWIALALPTLFAVATSIGWWQPLGTLALFLGLAATCTFGLEPHLYGQSAGVSRVAVVVGVALWTWLWGPVGLVIATPLTVCLIVLGRHVPELRYIAVLIGDEPVLPPPLRLYQRLLAGDHAEATDLVEAHVAAHPPHHVYDEVLLPALSAAQVDRVRGALSEVDEQTVLRAIHRILRELEEPEALTAEQRPLVPVLAFPAHDAFDELPLRMLKHVLAGVGGSVEIASPEILSSEAVALAVQRQAPIAVVGVLQPGGLAQLRYLCKRLRRDAPGVKIVAGSFAGRGSAEPERESLLAAGADVVVTSLFEARDLVLPWIQLVQSARSDVPATPERVA